MLGKPHRKKGTLRHFFASSSFLKQLLPGSFSRFLLNGAPSPSAANSLPGSLSSYSSFNPASSYISYGITPLKLSSMYGKPSSTDFEEPDFKSYHSSHQSSSSHSTPQPENSYIAMPFGTKVKISSIYELPSESVEASTLAVMALLQSLLLDMACP